MKLKGMLLAGLLALMLALCAVAAGELFTAAGTDLLEGTWVMTDFTDDTFDSCTMTFENGTFTMTVIINGETQSQQGPYTFDGEVLYLGGEPAADIELEGNVLTVIDDDDIMTLVRQDAEATLEGTWVMTDFTDDSIDSCTMIFSDGIFTMTFTSNGETISNQIPYTFNGTQLILDGEDPTDIVLNGDILTITDAGQTMTLVRQDTEAALEGTWIMTDFTGGEIDSCTMEFSNGILVMTVTLSGETQSQQAPYMFDGSNLYLNGEPTADIELNGDILKVTSAGETMTLQRK